MTAMVSAPGALRGSRAGGLAPVVVGALACGPAPIAPIESGTSESSESDGSESGTSESDTSESGGETETHGDPCADASTIIDDHVLVESAAQMAALADVVEIRGDLRIHDDAVVELVGANCLERITGTLFISDNESLERIDDAFVRLRLITNDELPDLTGMFITDNPALVSVTGLRALERIDRRVFVDDNPQLVDMRFDALAYVGENFSIGNPQLPTLEGLSALTEVGGLLTISDCDALVDLEGLAQLTAAGTASMAGGLAISGNDSLLSLAGLGLSSVPNLTISNNAALVDLGGLEALTAIGRKLLIADNPSLSSLAGLDNLGEIQGSDYLYGLSVVRNGSLTSLTGLESLVTVEHHLHLCDNASLVDLGALTGVEAVGRFTAIYNDELDHGEASALAAGIAGIEWIKVDANAGITATWWDKPLCPWSGDLICDEDFEFQGDVGTSCEQDCCDPWGPTHLCATDTDDDCQDEPLGPP